MLLQLENIKKSFHQHEVLKNVSLTIHEGDFIYLYGINGSGKSTLFKIICDILQPDDGTIQISEHTNIGAVIENPNFIEYENLYFNLKFLYQLKNKFDEKKVRLLCEQFALDIDDNTKLKAYSVGMRQKVGIIQAIMENQNLVLFDEPTRGLDKESIEIFKNIVHQLILDHKSVIIASHDEFSDMAFTRRIQLKNGNLIEE